MKLDTSKTNVMLDLETMSTAANAAIVSIGAVKFTDKIVDEFYMNVDLESSVNAGLVIDARTVTWWLQQDSAAQAALTDETYPLDRVLMEFSMWMDRDSLVWGNGASFDNVILGNAYEAIDEPQPWKFWNDMCYRTIKNLNRDTTLERKGTHHNALDDAKTQALHLIKIFNQT